MCAGRRVQVVVGDVGGGGSNGGETKKAQQDIPDDGQKKGASSGWPRTVQVEGIQPGQPLEPT